MEEEKEEEMRAGCVTYRVLRVVRVIGRAIEGGERCLRRLCGLHPPPLVLSCVRSVLFGLSTSRLAACVPALFAAAGEREVARSLLGCIHECYGERVPLDIYILCAHICGAE